MQPHEPGVGLIRLQLPRPSGVPGLHQQQCQRMRVQALHGTSKTLNTLSYEQAGLSLCPCHYVGHMELLSQPPALEDSQQEQCSGLPQPPSPHPGLKHTAIPKHAGQRGAEPADLREVMLS